MTNNMTIGHSIYVGGNEVQVTKQGKFQVTNPKGKVITLSQDQFQKQTLKNFDKIQNGEDFEYKKDRKGLKIAGAVVGTAAVVTGIIYRKEIGKYIKNFSFKKLWNNIKNLFKPAKNTPNVFNGKKPLTRNAYEAQTARETLTLKGKAIGEWTQDFLSKFDEMVAKTKGAVHSQKQKMYERLFAHK